MPPPSPPAPLTSPLSLPTNRLFRLTSASYNQDSDFGACAAEFGHNYRTADWDDLLSIPAAHMSSMLDGLGLRHYDDGALLTRHGSPTDNSWRRWFTARHDGHPPASWYVADQHGGLTLGYGAGPWLVSVMCVHRHMTRASSPPSPSPPPSPPAPLTSPLSLPTNRLFRLTSASYNQDSDFGACAAEFGHNYRTADWDDLLSIPAAHMSAMLDGIGLFAPDGALLTRHGSPTDARWAHAGEMANQGWRRWITMRHDGRPPANWNVADQHGGLTLGSLNGLLMSVMCTNQPPPPSPPPAPSPPPPPALSPEITGRAMAGFAIGACALSVAVAANTLKRLLFLWLIRRPRPAYNTGPLPLAATDEYASKGPLLVAVLVPVTVDEYARKTLV